MGRDHSQSVGGSLHFEIRLSLLAMWGYSWAVEKRLKLQKVEFEGLGVTDIIL